MKNVPIIAFPEKHFQDTSFEGLETTRMHVNGEMCIGVPMAHLEEVCKLLGITKKKVSQVKTDYQNIYLARINRSGGENATEKTAGVREAHQNEELRREYMELCGYMRKAKQLKMLSSQTARIQVDIERYQKHLVASLRSLEEKQRAIHALEEIDESFLSRFSDEFDTLLQHPDIEKFKIAGKKIIVYTTPIFISYHKKKYDIGRFQITINTDGSGGCVKMINCTRTIGDGRHHPHITYNGHACLGNIKEVIPHLIAEQKYAVAVSVCIQYLKSYENSETYVPYSNIENWPEEKGQKKEGNHE